MTSFRVGLARARNGEEVPNRREDDVRLGGECVDEVGVIEPVLKEGRQALLCVLRSYGFEQPLPRGDVAGRRGDTDPVVERRKISGVRAAARVSRAGDPSGVHLAPGEQVIQGADTVPNRVSSDVIPGQQDRKSTRLNSSHLVISYAVFCLKK